MTDIVETIREGNEPEQGLQRRSELSARELMRDIGAVLRMSEAEAAALADQEVDPDSDQTMIINMGPQHPSTHGVLRLMLELQGETVLRCKPIVGYLHTGMEKTGEELTFMQGGTNVTRMDYVSPLTTSSCSPWRSSGCSASTATSPSAPCGCGCCSPSSTG